MCATKWKGWPTFSQSQIFFMELAACAKLLSYFGEHLTMSECILKPQAQVVLLI